LPNALLEKLKDRFTFVSMEPVGHGSRVVRFCTSWATSQADVDDLCEALAERG
jgi:threonine aldolase